MFVVLSLSQVVITSVIVMILMIRFGCGDNLTCGKSFRGDVSSDVGIASPLGEAISLPIDVTQWCHKHSLCRHSCIFIKKDPWFQLL